MVLIFEPLRLCVRFSVFELGLRSVETFVSLLCKFLLLFRSWCRRGGRIFVKFRVKKLRTIRIKWITFAADGWPVSPVLVAPKPLFRMLANERFKSVPTSLSDLFSASRRGELNKIKNVNSVPFCVCHGNERENPLFGSFLKHGVHHGCAHAQPECA